jgi:hypothetical protein
MNRIIIIGEGQTEQEFCNDILQPYFIQLDIQIQAPTVRKTGGGIVSWAALKYQIIKHLKEDKKAIVSLLIDYYGIKNNHKYPNWDEAQKLMVTNKYQAIELIQQGMLNDIEDDLKDRFIPYIQLHEFEGLLFCDLNVFTNNFEQHEFNDFNYLRETISQHFNPEEINNGYETAPSKRLDKIINGYDKIVYGSLLADEIGLKVIREKCPGFNTWINNLELIKWN